HGTGNRHADGALLDHRAGAGHRGLAGAQEVRAAQRGHTAHAHPALCLSAGGRRDHHRGAHVLPRARAGSDRRTSRAADDVGAVMSTHARPLFERAIVVNAAVDSVRKLDPRRMIRNPVMFVVMVGSAFTTVLWLHALITGHGDAKSGFILAISLWLWFTVLFANFAEAMAEGRG